ncbi:MAG: hypothetical protein Q8O40_05615 [Chloroflexota bacterium]|nr:hypothetical protein [Chloroflexota bacterium]
MAVTLGSGNYVFEPVDGWAKIPAGWKFMDAPGVCVDSKDNVYVFTRGTHPLVVFDKNGKVVNTWGDDIFTRAHGLTMSPDGKTIWCTDDGDHTVRHCTLDGKVLLTIGTPAVNPEGFGIGLSSLPRRASTAPFGRSVAA